MLVSTHLSESSNKQKFTVKAFQMSVACKQIKIEMLLPPPLLSPLNQGHTTKAFTTIFSR